MGRKQTWLNIYPKQWNEDWGRCPTEDLRWWPECKHCDHAVLDHRIQSGYRMGCKVVACACRSYAPLTHRPRSKRP